MSYFEITFFHTLKVLSCPLFPTKVSSATIKENVFFRKEIPMPYVNIKITKEGQVTLEQKRRLIEGATNLLHDVLGKNKATTVVTIDEVDTDNWGIGGVPITEIRKQQK